MWKRGYAATKDYQYYKGKQNIVLNLGYIENDTPEIKIDFLGGGIYSFDDMKVIVQPMEHYAEQVDDLRIPIENLTIDNNNVTADIALEKPHMVCVAIPYDKGWSAKINGKKAELQLINGRYMGIELGKGNYHLELMYVIPGFTTGAIISAGTILALTVYALLNRYRKVKKS